MDSIICWDKKAIDEVWVANICEKDYFQADYKEQMYLNKKRAEIHLANSRDLSYSFTPDVGTTNEKVFLV